MRKNLVARKNCDISFKAIIGDKVRLPHPIGLVIGAAEIGNNVTIFQNVTLGSDGRKGRGKRYPKIEDNVMVYSGSVILGGVRIGKNSIIGANALVNKDVPPNSTAVGNPCKIIMKTR
ncbi:serine acetyltransferase [Akkermansiaceae bacterium]|nr:serine acetyltransferase [Akkermansiaceae bacterium]